MRRRPLVTCAPATTESPSRLLAMIGDSSHGAISAVPAATMPSTGMSSLASTTTCSPGLIAAASDVDDLVALGYAGPAIQGFCRLGAGRLELATRPREETLDGEDGGGGEADEGRVRLLVERGREDGGDDDGGTRDPIRRRGVFSLVRSHEAPPDHHRGGGPGERKARRIRRLTPRATLRRQRRRARCRPRASIRANRERPSSSAPS